MPGMKTFDWFGRLILLALSSFATLFLIGAMVQVSNTGTPGPPPGPGQIVTSATVAAPADRVAAQSSSTPATPTVAAQSHDDRDLLRWAEALTYAVTALALFAAAGVVVLLRLTAILTRIAGR